MAHLPISVEVSSRNALVVGLTEDTLARIERLVGAGAFVTAFARAGEEALVDGAKALGATVHTREPSASDLADAWLVFVAPGDDASAAALFAWGRDAHRLVCTLDRPQTCTFVNPAVARASGITVAISSDGASPAIVRKLREGLEAILGDERLARFVGAVRDLRASLPLGERARQGAQTVEGFRLEGKLVFPEWVDRA